ncbi:ammonia-forming cytochrome c nitrite reductase subunit c552 [Psychromonas sp. psych-6C06]|uniref:tetratricopeptide repeat protein n=1 Tax=Psychromonas sp. psych-6C06 TaxID=2058089 RepID=UPI000C3480C2|nr:ammonia-forming cytochrome c nitrite reductase subunit c552 [Psychromonas sp. psych-6C06]PKF61132.1 ammonia-forming cytochrome c nitrite reductase subunit c552 [Psychromonas sp. psych-6C06]
MPSNTVPFSVFTFLFYCLGLYCFFYTPFASANGDVKAQVNYVGNASCIECHQEEVENWQLSDHQKAMQIASKETVLGDFNNSRFESDSGWTIFNQDKQGFYIETGEIGKAGERFRVPYVFAYYPLQQILVDIGGGRLQAYTVAWDSREKSKGGQRWYNLYEETHETDSPFYWKGQFNNWNARCASCHSTDLKRGYSVDKDTYQTTFNEVNVSCEACHGPAETHIQLTSEQKKSKANAGFEMQQHKKGNWFFKSGETTAERLEKIPFSIDHGQTDQCASCHSRRVALSDANDPGDFTEHYIPRLAVPELYHADGQILDEVYVYGSFSQSKMAAAGVTCSNCHEPHTGKVLTQDNNLCAQCHLATEFDTPEHTLHKSGSEGALCIDCHMPTTRYMGVDDRRDHAYRIPNPWVSEALGTPNVCLDCHEDKDNQWSQKHLNSKKEQIFGNYDDIGPALLLNLENPLQGQQNIAKLVADETQPPMRRAVLLGHINMSKVENMQLLNELANSPQSLVKLGVISVLERSSKQLQLQVGFGLLYDDDKNVRLQAIKLLAPAFRGQLPKKAQKPMQDALLEAVTTYQKQQDLLSAQMALADLAYKIGDLEQAQIQYLNAINLQSSFLPSKLNLASIYRETNQLDKARRLLQEILKVVPDHAMALHNLGLVYVVKRDWPKALNALLKAKQQEPDNARFSFVYVLALEASGDIQGALKELQVLEQRTPGDPALKTLRNRLTQ